MGLLRSARTFGATQTTCRATARCVVWFGAETLTPRAHAAAAAATTDSLHHALQLYVAKAEKLPQDQTIPVFFVPNEAAYSLSTDEKVDVNAVLGAKGTVTLVTANLSGLGLPNQDTSAWQTAWKSAFGSSDSHRLVNIKYMDGFEYNFSPAFFNSLVKNGVADVAAADTIVVYEPNHYNITVSIRDYP